MTNPNNCETCKYKGMLGPDGEGTDLHCYMFKDAPTERCMQHSGNEDDQLLCSFAALNTALKKGCLKGMSAVVGALAQNHKP